MAVRSLTEVPIYSGLTYDEYLKLPPITQRYDIVDGDLFMSPSPSDEHQWILKDTAVKLDQFVRDANLGVTLFAPLDVIIRRLPRLRTRQPDLVFYSAESIGGTSRASLRNARDRDVPPDLAVEILSSSEHRSAQAAKLTDYAEIGIQEVWQIDPVARAITVLQLTAGRYQEVARFGVGAGEVLRSDLLPGFSLRVEEIFD